jgi:hypothetical protein
MNDKLRAALAALALAGLAAGAFAQEGPQSLPKVRLNAGIHNIDAMLAQTPEQREIGLMFRASMAANEGMLFTFERPAQQCFWMKNTLIPLDMLFLKADGSIAHIAHNAVPLDETPIESGAAVNAVLEVNGGTAATLGIKEGDRVEYQTHPAQ